MRKSIKEGFGLLKELDLNILELLSEDSRRSHQEIAEILGVEEAAVAAAIARMTEDGTIIKYTAAINWDKTGDERVEALIEVRVTPQREEGFDKIAQRIYRHEEVESVYLMSGAYDLMVMVRGRTLREVSLFVSQKLACLDNVLSTATHFVLKKYKFDGVILEKQEKPERLAVSP
jgi:DNA-binding Lrp family transcriptional regulator